MTATYHGQLLQASGVLAVCKQAQHLPKHACGAWTLTPRVWCRLVNVIVHSLSARWVPFDSPALVQHVSPVAGKLQ